ncbi:MAG: HAD-IA family hydrolase [Firmicutes bacterium]|nr:HAD-IA family hydrolase [Bacillota bacterium]
MKYKYLLFDLDGTLIDTNKLIIDSFKYTLKLHIDIDIEEGQIKKYFGEPLITTLKRFSEKKAEEMYDTYIKFNESIHDKSIKAFKNVDSVLMKLYKKSYSLSVVTSKRKVLAKRGLEICNLLRYFDKVVAYEDTNLHKPYPDPIIKALSLLRADPEQALMVGDSEYDINCARNAGVKSVFVNWSEAGFYQENIRSDFVIDEFPHLLDIV